MEGVRGVLRTETRVCLVQYCESKREKLGPEKESSACWEEAGVCGTGCLKSCPGGFENSFQHCRV